MSGLAHCEGKARVLWARLRAVLLSLLIVGGVFVQAAGPPAWSQKDTRLATEYLNLLVQKPEYGRVLDLLWDLYDKNLSTQLLLDSIAAQTKTQTHPNVLLVHAHLLRKAGRNDKAQKVYQAVLEKDPKSFIALRALADLALEQGDKEKAIRLLDQLIKTLPEDDVARTPLLEDKGRLAAEIGKLDVAGAAWTEALRLRKNDAAFTREIAQLMVGAGLLDKALAIYREMVKTSDPVGKLNALYDLARLEEQADHFDEAARALRDGLALSHFKDWHYEEFFRRLVKLHERYGQLDALKAQLLKEARNEPPQEKALMDMARFSDMVVDPDEQVHWLRELTKNFPEQLEYRWALVRALMDHDGLAEAAKLLDGSLKGNGGDNAALVLLRCEVHLRAGEPQLAVQRLQNLLSTQGQNPDVEKSVYQFAVTHTLDSLVETVLRSRLAADPSKEQAVFELTSFLMKRQRADEVATLLEKWAGAGAPQGIEEYHRRLRNVSGFYAASQNLDAALEYAKRAANSGRASRDDLLQLADTEAQKEGQNDSPSLLEKAWKLSDTPEKHSDVDERIFALLSGETAAPTAPAPNASTEFRLPPLFTGEGFGSDTSPPEKRVPVAEAVRNFALARASEAMPGHWPMSVPLLGLPVPWSWTEGVHQAMADNFPLAPPDILLRAAWWCLRADELDLALSLTSRLVFDRDGRRITGSPEAEKLLLEIAQEDKNPLLIVQQLQRLARMDPGNRTVYERRLAEQYLEMSADPAPRNEADRIVALWLRERATAILERLAKEDPTNETILSALAQCYAVMQKRDAAAALWEHAVHEAKGNAAPLLERYAESLITQHRFKDFVEAQMRLLEEETDLKKRRDIFSRALERLMWADSLRGDLPEEEKKPRLDLMVVAVKSHSQKHPFDGFWFEALAHVYERLGDTQKAFVAMKQAYYTAPDTPFSLEQLRAAAMDAGDLKSAIYFQKQIAVAAPAKDEAGEWRSLVQLLEQDYRLSEADQVRRRLESRFAQDPASLEELAKYYEDSAQDEAASRVLGQIARVQSWQPTALFRLALAQEKLGANAEAEQTLRKLLAMPGSADKDAAGTPPERQSWPLFDTHSGKSIRHEGNLEALETAPGLATAQRDTIRGLLSMPHSAFAEQPDDASVRLRAVEELARLHPEAMDAKTMEAFHFSEMERAWALFHAGKGREFRTLLASKLGDTSGTEKAGLEKSFIYAWLGVKSHGVADLAAWVRAAKTEDSRHERTLLIVTVLFVLAEDPQFDFTDADLVALGESGLMGNTDLVELARKLEHRQQFHQALLLGEAAKKNAPSLEAEYGMFVAKIAEAAGDTVAEDRFLREAWSCPLQPEPASAFDPFLQSFAKLLRLARTPAEREHLIEDTWRRLREMPPSGQNKLRQALVLGIVGADEVSARKLGDFLGNDFLAARAFIEPMPGRLPPGMQAPGPRIDELTHLHGYWDDLREWDEVLRQDGLAALLPAVGGRVMARNGGTFFGPRANYEFTGWHYLLLAHQLRTVSFPERLRLIRDYLAGDDSVETLGELGKFLESQNLARECVEVYRQLPDRAPSNTDYCKQFLTFAETAWDYEAALPYIDKLRVAEPQFRPQNIPEGFVEEKQAEFLARLHDTARLRALAFHPVPALKTNRVPDEVPYLRELAPLLEREGDQPGALAAWDQLAAIWPRDEDAALHRARLLVSQGQKDRALEALRKMPMDNFLSEAVQDGIVLRARLAADAGLWDEVRLLMNLVVDGDRKPGSVPEVHVTDVIAVSQVLADHQRTADAQGLLVRAERAVKDDAQRFQLRLEELRVAALDPAWDPRRDAARIAALLRTPIEAEGPLKTFAAWLSNEAKSPRADAWFEVLKESQPEPNAAVALAALGRAGDVESGRCPRVKWNGELSLMGVPRRVTVRLLLEHHQPALAKALITQDDPLLVPVLVALGDEAGLHELFARLVRQSFPGGLDAVDYAEALAREGRDQLAEEFYGLALESLHTSGGVLPPLVKSYARFLIKHRRFEQAETLLMQDGQDLTDGMPEIFAGLYRDWNKLDRIDAELVKFHLPDGVREETRFLARQTHSAK